jgi:HEAT repeat protein
MIAATALGLLARADSIQGWKLAMERVRAGQPDRVRGQAVSILRRSLKPSAAAEKVFIGLLHDRIRWIRSSAVNALGERGGEASVEPLKAIAANVDDDLARQAADAAEKIAKRLKAQH